jgi:hypothetical protein
MLAWGIALGIRLLGKSSAESAIQSLPGDWRMAHMMIEFVQEVNRAFSAGALFVPRILGRFPRLAVNCAFGAQLVPVARIASLLRRSLGGSGRLGSTVSQCAEDSAHSSAKFAFRTRCFGSARRPRIAFSWWLLAKSDTWTPIRLRSGQAVRTPKVRRLPDETASSLGLHHSFVNRHLCVVISFAIWRHARHQHNPRLK